MAAVAAEAWISRVQDRLPPDRRYRGGSPGSTTQARALLPGLLDGTG